MEDSLVVLKDGRPTRVAYETTFLVQFPEHLGGGDITIDFVGAMVLVPLMGVK
ncbi:hypothetical protein [Virgisporangium aurantiacum]|uniref:Uncharacterized protein n=1 Tax=Virgisporangium aurantiacum TaxID=175570 RepID=A0A8J3ZKU5_9ACTN|nr:hypothetical protein [Virgisporangium aurantiacum]GIJ63323.1 hypothetical protein Vau01_108390 [Virgisporangium aurantiacum]